MSGFVGVVCGLKSEAAVVRRVLRAGEVDGALIRIGISGADAARAEEIAAGFCEAGARAIISVGVSGALAPALAPGDLLLAEEVRTVSGECYKADASATSLAAISGGGGWRSAVLLGADEIIASPAEKAALFARTGALAVDMESHGCARAVHRARGTHATAARDRAGVAFVAARAVADPAVRALPPAAMNAVAPDGSTRVMTTLFAALRDPKQFPDLMQLGSDSSAALQALEKSLGPLLRQLVEGPV